MGASFLPVALVTGASSGIGRDLSAALVAAGYRVFGSSRRQGAPLPAGVEPLLLDVTQDASVSLAVSEVLAATGRLDVLVNNAGIALAGAIEESTVDQARSLFETNLFGAMRMTRAVLPTFRAQGAGRILNISSVVGFLPAAYMGHYAASKHALEGYSESLDHELRTRGIRVSLIEPAFTASSIGDHMPEPDAPLPEYAAARSRMKALMSTLLQQAPSPATVSATALKALRARDPAVRYPVAGQASLLYRLRRLLPTTVFERSLRKQFQLDVAD